MPHARYALAVVRTWALVLGSAALMVGAAGGLAVAQETSGSLASPGPGYVQVDYTISGARLGAYEDRDASSGSDKFEVQRRYSDSSLASSRLTIRGVATVAGGEVWPNASIASVLVFVEVQDPDSITGRRRLDSVSIQFEPDSSQAFSLTVAIPTAGDWVGFEIVGAGSGFGLGYEGTQTHQVRIRGRLIREDDDEESVRIGVSYQLGHHFPANALRVGPLLIKFEIEEGPPGAYIKQVVSVTPGWDVFHTPVDFPPDDPTPTVWEYGYADFHWDDVLQAADGTPIQYRAVLEVFVGYDGDEQVFERVNVQFVVRVDAIARIGLLRGEAYLMPKGTTRSVRSHSPLQTNQSVGVTPGEVLRVYPHTRVLMHCVSGMVWLLETGSVDTLFVDFTLGASWVLTLSQFPKPRDASYVEMALNWGADQVQDEARDRLVQRAVGKTASGFFGKVTMVLGILGIGDEAPLGGNDVFAVRLRSEVSLDFRADGGVIARTFEGAPEVIGAGGAKRPLPVGYQSTRQPGTGSFTTPVPHNYRSADDLPPLPGDPGDPQPDPSPPDDAMTHTYGTVGGWYLMSVPTATSLTSELTFWRWNPRTRSYERPTSLQPTHGSWARLQAHTRITLSGGSQVTSDATLDLGVAGWHMISAPWSYPLSAVRVVRGGQTRTWAEAVAAGWVRRVVYGFKATDGAYTMPSTLHPWYGYWLDAKVSGLSLRFVYASRVSTADAGSPAALAPTALGPLDLPPLPPAAGAPTGLAAESHPNPVTGDATTFRVSGPLADAVEEIRVRVVDLSGRTVWEDSTAGGALSWHAGGIANGVYLYEVQVKLFGEWTSLGRQRLLIMR